MTPRNAMAFGPSRTGARCSGAGGRKELDRIARGIVEQDLAAASPHDDLAAEAGSRRAQRRDRDPRDRRAYTLYLTPAGRELLAELQGAADEDEAELLSALDAAERSQLITLLQRVAESQGLTPGVHPNLTKGAGGDHTARDAG